LVNTVPGHLGPGLPDHRRLPQITTDHRRSPQMTTADQCRSLQITTDHQIAYF